ncbi:EAL domain-containing protein [Leptothoe sp. PORK10 BA2]|uniref:EAL domain-containing protein n=1 Tax=Leptothoe sp. PORK10 BA2 TaxID=3110254 RepID=UPI002B205CC8|nr:EAL domain-containing protein [Leptothoe sp. PORK10 BA2]MEA5462397.1 EAL domain-containing protein [Leptothoe sp. PORK10 BA2]
MSKDFNGYGPLLIVREAFTSLLPIVLAINILVLVSNFTSFLDRHNITALSIIDTDEINRLYFFLIPLFFNLSFSSLLAKEKDLDRIGATLVSMVCFFRASGFININDAAQITSQNGSILTSILCTVFSINGLYLFSKFRFLRLLKNSNNVSPRLKRSLNLSIPGLLTVLCIEVLANILRESLGTDTIAQLIQGLPKLSNLSQLQELILYKVLALSAWLFGLHGEYTADGLFRLIQDIPVGEPRGITLKTFHDVFMNIGGSGSTLVIPFIILWTKQTPKLKSIARLSIPFSLFNINEILLFGLPIILSPLLFLPFFLAPFVNMIIALIAISLGLFDITLTPYVHWMSPPFYSAYVASTCSIPAMVTQLICIAVDGLIYLPFIVLINRQYQTPSSLANFLKVDAYDFLYDEIDHYEERLFFSKQKSDLSSIEDAQETLRQLKGGTLILFFQPKFHAQTLEMVGMEALLRLQNRKGEFVSPTFLSGLYRQGLSKSVDIKVTDLVFEQSLKWQKLGLSVPTISMNFDKDFLLDQQAVEMFINRAREQNISFCIEITEHTYTVQLDALKSVIKKLRHSGHKISIDDFGAGYSSLTSLLTLDADEIKLDRKLVVPPEGELERGRILLKSSIQLCHDLGFYIVAEGVETSSQLKFLQECGVDTIQGYYLGKPMHPRQVVHLFPTLN